MTYEYPNQSDGISTILAPVVHPRRIPAPEVEALVRRIYRAFGCEWVLDEPDLYEGDEEKEPKS